MSARLFVPRVAAIRRLASGDDGIGLASGLFIVTSSRKLEFGASGGVPHFSQVIGDILQESRLEFQCALNCASMETRGGTRGQRNDRISQE